MLLGIAHRTVYRYDRPVRHSKNEVRAVPVTDVNQTCLASSLEVVPAATFPLRYRDYHGTEVVTFDIDKPHDTIELVASATVATRAVPGQAAGDGWPAGDVLDELEMAESLLPSALVTVDADVRAIAERLGTRDALRTVDQVVDWVRQTLRYQRGATTVRSSVAEVLARRQGVCQDFAHVTCAVLRAAGVPARYVSGYFAPDALHVGDEDRVEGHAWVEAGIERQGWWAIDPTNQQAAVERHVKVGHGRDYADVPPVRGVYRGGHGRQMEVEVRIRRLGATSHANGVTDDSPESGL
jgi:transglutaminase-like putative cysteine protease